MVYKSLNGLALNYLSSKFIQQSDVITSYNLRDSVNKLAIPLPRTNGYRNSFAYVTYQHVRIGTYCILYLVYAYLSRIAHLCRCRKPYTSTSVEE